MLLWQLKLKILILIGAKHLRIIIDKVDVFIRPYDGTRYLVLLGPEKYDTIYFMIGLDILSLKVVYHILLLIIMEISKLIHMMCCL